MFKRLIIFLTLAAFLNTILGCSSVKKRSLDEIAAVSERKITAIGLYGEYPFEIKIKDLVRIYVTKIRGDTEGGSIVDTVAADQFKQDIVAWPMHEITAVDYKDGERLDLVDREIYYDPYENVIQVAGSEIVFDKQGGRIDTTAQVMRGLTADRDSVEVALEEIAYVRQIAPDGVKILILVVSIIGVLGGLLVIMMAGVADTN
jgi:hypothetical protein